MHRLRWSLQGTRLFRHAFPLRLNLMEVASYHNRHSPMEGLCSPAGTLSRTQRRLRSLQKGRFCVDLLFNCKAV
jgi:hypothetical protein